MSNRAKLLLAGVAALAAAGAWWLLSARGGAREVAGVARQDATSPTLPDLPAALGLAATADAKVTLAPEVARGVLGFARKRWTTLPLRLDDRGRSRAMMRAIASRMI